MALINCPYCGKKVSDMAEHCPHCHNKVNKVRVTPPPYIPSKDDFKREIVESRVKSKNKLWFLWIGILLIVIVGTGVVYYFLDEEEVKYDKELPIVEVKDNIEDILSKQKADSIDFEEKKRLTPEIWLNENQISFRSGWRDKLLSLGFSKSGPRDEHLVDGDYDEEMYLVWHIDYYRNINNRKQTIKDFHSKLVVTQSGEKCDGGGLWERDDSVSIIFEDKEDYNKFKEQLKKYCTYYYDYYGIFDDPSNPKSDRDIMIKFEEEGGKYEIYMYEIHHQY